MFIGIIWTLSGRIENMQEYTAGIMGEEGIISDSRITQYITFYKAWWNVRMVVILRYSGRQCWVGTDYM